MHSNKRLAAIREMKAEELQHHLERYREEAIKLGASEAKIITTNNIIFDRRVTLKCLVPLCIQYGTCLHCPPYGIDPDRIREIIQEYHYGVLIKIDIDPSYLTDIEISQGMGQKDLAEDKALSTTLAYFEKLYEIVGKIESMAFHDGHHLAAGFAAGSCNAALCKFQQCQALGEEGRCRYPFKARPSMEACGMDVFKIASKVGWEIYPIGGSCEAGAVPHGSVIGLVLID